MTRMSLDSYKILMEIRKRMNELVEQSIRQFDLFTDLHTPAAEWSAPFDVMETDSEIVVFGEIPGVRKEDVNVTLVGTDLIVRGERRPDPNEEKEITWHQAERRWGRFERTLPLPEEVVASGVTTLLRNGLLKVCLPKRQPKTIPVK